MRPATFAALLTLLLMPSPARAEQASAMPPGTSSISGRVTAAETGKPIHGAVVEIVIYNNLSSRFRQVTTDADGKYEFAKLPVGRYQLAAQAARYVRMQYGQQQPGPVGMNNPARTIELAEGQAFTTGNFSLSGFSAIEGRVVDEFGDPVPNVAIQVSQVMYAGGRRRLMPANPSPDAGPPRPTDDLGRFRIGGLVPGDYYVEALSGAFADPTAAGGFAVTFFPGTSKASGAQAVTAKPGQDALDVVFGLTPAAAVRVSGVVVDGDGRPVGGGTLMLMPSERTGTALMMMARGASDAGGRFTFRNVPPGVYTLQAFGAMVGGGGNLGAAAFGYQTFTVEGQDIDALTVRVPAARTLRGRITFDGDMSLLPKVGDVMVSARQIDFESAPIGGGPSPMTVREDWTFEVAAMSGLRVVTASSRSGWTLKRATLNGVDVTDVALDFRERDVNGLEIVLTTRTSIVTGTVVGAEEKPLADVSVVIFADDESKWSVWSRYVTFTRTGVQGTFTVRGLPAGTYVAVAVESAANGEWQDPEFLKRHRLRADAVRFALAEEESRTVKVTVKK